MPIEELERLYKTHVTKEVAKHFKVSSGVVLRNLHEYGIPVRKSGYIGEMPEERKMTLRKPKSVPAWNKGLTKETDERLMKLSKSLTGKRNNSRKPKIRQRPKIQSSEMVECACGCGEMRPKFDDKGRRRYYIRGHCKSEQFENGRIPWNKDGKMPESSIRRGSEASGYKDGRALTPNFCIECGAEIGYLATRCVKCAHKMELNSSWLGGKSFEQYGIEFNDELKNQIRDRDNYTCQECGYNQVDLGHSLSIHHIDYDKCNNNPDNLISLCRSCHQKTNFNREDWTDYFSKRQQ